MNFNNHFMSGLAIILLLALSRLIPHPPKFTPILGMAVFSGAIINQKLFAYIIPLAALVGAPLCEKFKKDAINTNLGTIKTLSKIVTKKNKLIYLTTNSGYGIGKKNKFCDENSPLNPVSLYGKTKCDGEDLVKLKIKNSIF